MSAMMSRSAQHGFTLIEVMVVIVVMGIMASLIVLNIGGSEHRKALQAREIFLLDLEKIALESTDQSRVFALDVQTATDVSPTRYAVLEYQISREDIYRAKTWERYTEFQRRELPDHVFIKIQSTDYSFQNANNTDLTQAQAPKLIWLGNGEAKPVRIQFYYEQHAIGEEIEIDHLGQIHAS